VAASKKGLAICTCDLSDPTGYGRVVRDARKRVRRIVEHKDASAKELRIREWYAGFLAAPAQRMSAWLAQVKPRNAQKEYYLTDVIRLAAQDRVKVETVKAAEPWEVAGVNSRHELAILERAYQNAQARKLLEAGVALADLWRVDVRGELVCGRDVAIDVNCVFEGRVTLGDRVRVGPNCVLRNVTVEADSEIRAFSLLEDATVGKRCRIGPYARLRPGAALAEEVHIGNFVEVKASRIGAGSKANHLAYIGDAEVGARVNIGAGTITCNYDGASKHRTVIEDDCFIGSDATLVAPVTIAKGSYIGAGSTISKSTPPGQLTVARAKQVSLPNWKPRKK
jgi:bifunctional UDP-N-acetylglucosamine pyrophosphorylase/glucosamine-1-phosphate N-acetyltransferase